MYTNETSGLDLTKIRSMEHACCVSLTYSSQFVSAVHTFLYQVEGDRESLEKEIDAMYTKMRELDVYISAYRAGQVSKQTG